MDSIFNTRKRLECTEYGSILFRMYIRWNFNYIKNDQEIYTVRNLDDFGKERHL